MLVDFENCESTGESSIFLPLRGTVDYAVAAGWPMMFTTYMAGVDGQATGENTTPAFAAFAESVTHLGTERNDGIID